MKVAIVTSLFAKRDVKIEHSNRFGLSFKINFSFLKMVHSIFIF